MLIALCACQALAYEPPRPGDPASLLDWRWLARPQVGTRQFSNDPWGKRKLDATEGGFLALDVPGPGVLDHLWAPVSAGTRLTIEVDGKRLWEGPFGAVGALSQKRPPKGGTPNEERPPKGGTPNQELRFFPEPLFFEGGGMQHVVAPIGFQRRLRLLVDKPAFAHFASYRVLPKDSPVLAADAAGPYAESLRAAAELWKKGGSSIHSTATPPARAIEQPFVLPANGRVVAFQQEGSGEVTGLEFHVNPALTGTMREVVAEFTYDGADAPSLRLPLTDLAGVPHPWPCGRWDRYNGDLAAGLKYPWYLPTPRYHFPEATVHFNLPIPFARGLRIELKNRSGETQFAGTTRLILEPLAEAEARRAGRLCGTRLLRGVAPAPDTQPQRGAGVPPAHSEEAGRMPAPLLAIVGPGQLVGLGLFLTGNSLWPPAVHENTVALAVDDGNPITGPGLLPLWFQGIYGGPVLDRPIWNHPRFEESYAGVMRHFLADPIPFGRTLVFGFTPGPKAEGAPKEATVLALWYHFGPTPYAARPLPDQAERLPHQTFGDVPLPLGPGEQKAELAWAVEAEDLAPMAVAHQTELRVVEDTEHNYHPSGGKYLHVVADRPGSYIDCAVPLPNSRYLAVGFYPLWGPGRATFELDVLSRAQAKAPPEFPQGDAFVLGRVLGSVPMKMPIFSGEALDLRRDPGCHHTPPILNPAPDQPGVFRIICQAKPLTSSTYLLELDRIRVDTPAPTEPGCRECEEMPEPKCSGGLAARVPRHGRFAWSGWGALLLESPPGGKAELTALIPVGPARPSSVRLRGCLGPDQGSWQVQAFGVPPSGGPPVPVPLAPGKDADEVVEWVIPGARLSLPGAVVLEFTCVAAGKTAGGTPAKAQLAIDCLTASGSARPTAGTD